MTDDLNSRIQLLAVFKDNLRNWDKTHSSTDREWLNRNKHRVEREVTEAGCLKLITIYPPPAVGGLAMLNTNPFNYLFERPYLMSMTPAICDMVDQTIGVLENPLPEPKLAPAANTKSKVERGLAFVVMAMDEDNPELVDVLNTIKDTARGFEITAVRIDDDLRRSRITDRMLESIQKAEFVIVDLTHERPNVFYEAGYALGIGKTPIYIAKQGTNIHFNVQDYPVKFFKNMAELKAKLVLAFASAMAFREYK